MTHIRVEGSRFDASIETVWRYLIAGDVHGRVHASTRNREVQPTGDVTAKILLERHWNGQWVREM